MQQTVTARGFAWNSSTRTYSNEVRFEAPNLIAATRWVESKYMQLENLSILQTNEEYLLQSLLDNNPVQAVTCEVIE